MMPLFAFAVLLIAPIAVLGIRAFNLDLSKGQTPEDALVFLAISIVLATSFIPGVETSASAYESYIIYVVAMLAMGIEGCLILIRVMWFVGIAWINLEPTAE